MLIISFISLLTGSLMSAIVLRHLYGRRLQKLAQERLPSNQTLIYSFDIEKHVTEAIRIGSEEAYIHIDRLVSGVQENAPSLFLMQQAMLQLLGSIGRAMVESGVDEADPARHTRWCEELLEHKEAAEMLIWLRQKLLEPYFTRLAESQAMRCKQKVGQIVQLIHSRYMDDISLDWCADQCGMHTYELSRAFKEVTGTNYIEYLTDYRLDRAKELLLHSDMKIHDIAAMVGYQLSYFYRQFKKYESMTPKQFRESAGNI
jgi:AraC-like DNA-binding protein